MIINTALSRVSYGIFLLVISCALLLKITSSANQTTSKRVTPQLASLSDRTSVQAAGRGNPSINLGDGRDVIAEYVGDDDASNALRDDLADPLALASADFDEDGIPDLVSMYARPTGGIVTLHRGNADSIFPNSPEAQQRKATGIFTTSPLLSPVRVFKLPLRGDFIAAGDFDADGHADLLIAARGSSSLYILPGDGKGGLGTARQIGLPGTVTAIATGEMNRADGLMDIAVGIVSPNGPQALVFQGLAGAVKAPPQVFSLRAPATALALGSLDEDYLTDLAIAAGRELLIVHGQDRSTVSDEATQAEPRITRRSLEFVVRSLAIGHFSDTSRASLALLSNDGALHLLNQPATSVKSRIASKPVEKWQDRLLSIGQRVTEIVGSRVSSAPTDSLILIDPLARQLHIVASDSYSKQKPYATSLHAIASLDLAEEPAAVLPIQLNNTALPDLMILKKGRSAPAVVTPQSMMTFTVLTSADTLGSGSLRDAIINANNNAGPDLIVFQVAPAGPFTINLAAPLPNITDAVTIDGTTQPGFAGKPIVEINGSNMFNGLRITAGGGTTVRGVVINRTNVAIDLTSTGNNLIQGSFIGTDLSGTGTLGSGIGVSIQGGANNVIGAAAAAARNIMSGNGNAFQSFGTGNVIRNNFIGTDVTGTVNLGNSTLGFVGGGTNTVIRDNVISGNGSGGILIQDSPGSIIQGNRIGTDASGQLDFGNGEEGIDITNSPGTIIGGLASGAGNVIAFSATSGILVEAGSGHTILSNSIFSNNGIGIDLGDDGVTPNDQGDGDVGANNLQNFPVLTSVDNSVGSTFIRGTLNSTPNTTFTLQFFANDSCHASGFGEGRQFIGTRSVTTNSAGNASFSFTFGSAFAPPVTATATDPSGNTSEFSACVSASAVDLAVTISGAPNPVVPGETLTYTITAINKGPVIADNVTVTDVLPGALALISCSSNGGGTCSGTGNVRQVGFNTLFPGTSATITLVTRVNAAVVNGTVISNAVTIESDVTDANPVDNIAMTSTVVSTSPPAMTCSSNIFQSIDSGKCTAVVTYPLPVANIPALNLIINCSPPSGSTFPVGSTAVSCSARDAKSVVATCSFFITVNAPVSVTVALEGGGSVLDLGPAAAQRKTRKPPKGCACDRIFTIQNNGCASFGLAPPSILRIGNDVTNGKITNPNDSSLFSLRLVLADGSELPVPCGPMCFITSEPGQKLTFRVLFKPGIPAFSGKTDGLSSVDVLPDTITSRITFNLNTTPPSSSTLAIDLVAHVSTDVQIINPDNARGAKLASFTKSGNEFTVSFGVFDSDLDVNRARFEFLDSNGRLVAEAFDVDITQPITQGNIVRGQSFDVVQKFTGAKDHPQVASVRVTVSDAHSSDSITTQLGSSASSSSLIQSLQHSALIKLPVREFQLRP